MIPRACKRLAEADFPIAEVSQYAVRENSIQHKHPLASSRARLMALCHWSATMEPAGQRTCNSLQGTDPIVPTDRDLQVIESDGDLI